MAIFDSLKEQPVPASSPENEPVLSFEARISNAQRRSQGGTQIPGTPLAKTAAAGVCGEPPSRQPQPNHLGKMELAREPMSSPPTSMEDRWAGEKMAEELQEVEEADVRLAPSREPKAEAAGKQRKKRKSLGRTNQIKTRLTDAELTQFQQRVKKSGLAQGEYLRSVALTGKIVIEEHSMVDVALLDELAMIRAELGRQGGLLKMIIKPNEGQRELAPEEWAELIGTIRRLEQTRKELSRLEVRISNDHHNA